MKRKILNWFYVGLILSLLYSPLSYAQIQLGGDINGEATGDWSGGSVSLDGNRLAIGARYNDGIGTNAGHVRVYEWTGNTWIQLGRDLDGKAEHDEFGFSVSLDGDRLAVGGIYNDGNGVNSGHVRVYQWTGSAWIKLDADIDGEAEHDVSGRSVSLDGDRLAIGAPYNDNRNGVDAGHVRVYQWTGISWTQLGADIDGEAAHDHSGVSVSLDGDRLAIGARLNDGNGSNSGHVRIYQWTGTAWIQLGADIDGEAAGDQFGVSVSLDGDRLAIGAFLNDGNGVDAGHVRVYQWTGTVWAKLSADIYGEAIGDWSGQSVSLDGDRLLVGAYNNDGNGSNSGHARIYQWNGNGLWVQLGVDIDGEAAGDESGVSVSLDGNRLVVGGRKNDGSGTDAGHVRVYELCVASTGTAVQRACGSYTWIDGNTYTSSTQTPTHTLVGGAANGCDSVVTLDLTITSGLDKTVVFSEDELISSEMGLGTSYQWIDCADDNEPIFGAIYPIFEPSSSGSYGLILQQDGCLDTTTCVGVSLSDLERTDEDLDEIAVYPNPNRGEVSLDLGSVQEASVRLSNALGQVLWTKELQAVSVATLNIEGASGIYFLEVKTAAQDVIFRLLKE